MLNLIKDNTERAARYGKWAGYALGGAWGLLVFMVVAIAITGYSYYLYDIPMRPGLIVVTVIFFSAPSIMGFWVYEVLRGQETRYLNRVLRISNQLLQTRIVALAACSQCKTVIVQMRADQLMESWDAKNGPASDG